jgi:hypothetical protein
MHIEKIILKWIVKSKVWVCKLVSSSSVEGLMASFTEQRNEYLGSSKCKELHDRQRDRFVSAVQFPYGEIYDFLPQCFEGRGRSSWKYFVCNLSLILSVSLMQWFVGCRFYCSCIWTCYTQKKPFIQNAWGSQKIISSLTVPLSILFMVNLMLRATTLCSIEWYES